MPLHFLRVAFGISDIRDGLTELSGTVLTKFEEIAAMAMPMATKDVVIMGPARNIQGDVIVGVEECREGGDLHPEDAFSESAVVHFYAVMLHAR